MRRAVFVGAGLLALFVFVMVALSATEPAAEVEATLSEAPDAVNARAAAIAQRLRESAGVDDFAPAQEPTGALSIHGRVVGPSGPIGGAVVTATLTQEEESLSELPCDCGNACGLHLLECMCAEAAGQIVTLVSERRGEAQPIARATTAEDGTFVLRGVEATTYGLWARSPTHVGMLTGVVGGSLGVEVPVEDGIFIAGKVKDEKGEGLEGAVVTAIHPAHSRFFDVLSGADGTFRIGPVPVAEYAAVAVHSSLLPANESVRRDTSEQLELTLFRPRAISGRVLREGAPVANAEVRFEGEHRKERVRTDPEGAFAFARARPGEYSLIATAGSETASTTVEVAEADANVDLALGRGAELTGTVRTQSGAGISGADVGANLSGSMTFRTKTDSSGRFRFAALPSGEPYVWVKAEGFLPPVGQRTTIAAGGATSVDFTLIASAPITGVVLSPDGAPIPRVTVEAKSGDASETAKTDEEGRFALKELPGGATELKVSHPDFLPLTRSLDAPASAVRLELSAGLQLRGTVMDGDRPVANARVMARPSDEDSASPSREAHSDRGGAFTVRGLEPGRYVLRAQVQAEERTRTTLPVEAVAPQSGSVELTFTDHEVIAGVVVDESGKPVAGVKVIAMRGAYDPDRPWRSSPVGEGGGSTADGTFRIQQVMAETHFLVTFSPGYVVDRPLDVIAPTSSARVVVRRLPQVRGRVLTADREPVLEFRINGAHQKTTDGRFALDWEDEQTALRLVFDAGPQWAQTVRHATRNAGDTDLGDIVLSRGTAVEGVVLDAETGAGVPGALVYVGDAVADLTSVGLSPEAGAVRTDAEGRFRLTSVEERPLWLYAKHAQYPLQGAALTTRAHFELRIQRGGTVLGQIRGAIPQSGGNVTASSQGRGHAFARIDRQGRFKLEGLRSGDWTLRVGEYGTASQAFDPRRISITSPEIIEVELAPRTGGGTLLVELSTPGFAMLWPGAVPPLATKEDFEALGDGGVMPARDGSRLAFRNVAAGEYTLIAATFHADGAVRGLRVHTQPVQIAEGGAQTLRVEVAASAPLISLDAP